MPAVLAAAVGSAAGSSASPATRGLYCPNRIATAHFVLEFSVPREDGSAYAALCERTYRQLRGVFSSGSADPIWQGKCRVYLFATQAEFVRFARTVHKSAAGAASGGYTRVTKRDPAIVLFRRGDDVALQQTLVHEMTHVFLGLFYQPAPLPTWVQEGCAQYFEFRHVPARSRLALARQTAKGLAAANGFVPFRLFSVFAFGPTDLRSYCQAWSMLDFLINAKPGYGARASEFIILLKDGKSQAAALHAAYGCDFARFEAAWREYVLASYGRPPVLSRAGDPPRNRRAR